MNLKPCPFCGGEAEIINIKPDRPYFAVKCKECRAQSRTAKCMTWKTNKERFAEKVDKTKQWAAEAWNRRVTDE